MKIPDFISSLTDNGITVDVDGDNLVVDDPEGALSPEIQHALLENKTEIIAYILGRREPRILKVDRNRSIPASSSQRGLWFQYLLEGPSSTYNLPYIYHLNGKLDIQVLKKSLDYLFARHDSMRMSFRVEDSEPYLNIEETLEWTLEIHINGNNDIEQEILEAATKPFSLEVAPLLRVHMWTDSRERHTLLFVFHHSITDDWSHRLFEQELTQIYNGYVLGKEPDLPGKEVDYADYAIWQHEQLHGTEFDQGIAYWRDVLQDAPELLDLPTDQPRPQVQTFQGKQETLPLTEETVEQLQDLARREKVNLFMLLSAAYAILLARYCRQEHVIIGVPMANRPLKQSENILGYFVNMVPLHFDLSGNPNFHQFLERVQRISLEGYKWQGIPFDSLTHELQRRRDPKYSPIFQTSFSLDNHSSQEFHLGEIAAHREIPYLNAALYDVSFSVTSEKKKLQVNLTYNTDLFKPETASRMLEHYQLILEWIISTPSDGINEFSLLSEDEHQKILVDWISTDVSYPDHTCLHELFEEQVRKTPDAAAVVMDGLILTYSELNRRADLLASILLEAGIGPEKIVGLYYQRSFEMITGMLATLKAGGAFLPLSTDDPGERVHFLVSDSQPVVILTTEQMKKKLPELDNRVICWSYNSDVVNDAIGNLSEENANPGNLACIIYTSGSTGNPKGVMLTHRALGNHFYCHQMLYKLTPQDRMLHHLAVTFVFALWEIFAPLLTGAQIVIADPKKQLEAGYLLDLIEDQKITCAGFGPSLLEMFLESQPTKKINSLRQVLCGGEVLSPELANLFLKRYKSKLYNIYGATETCIDVSAWECQESDSRTNIPIGRPYPNSQFYILDNIHNPVPIGVPGELYIGGPSLARGYINRPELTNERFIENPFQSGTGSKLYKTGDLVRWLSDGNIEFIGRIDGQIKLRGFRIEPGEIEYAIKKHSGVQHAAVIMIEGAPRNKCLVGYVVPKAGFQLDKSEVHDFLSKILPSYMIPVSFVFLSKLPLTTNGKIDRGDLPPPNLKEGMEQYFPPKSSTERQLVLFWQDVLGIKKVGVEDHFFELGGHSLLAARLLARIREETGCTIAFTELLENDTVRKLARLIVIKGKRNPQKSHIPRADRSKPIPASSSQRGLWFQYQLEGKSVTYNVPVVYTLHGILDFQALEKSFQYLVNRHESLRMGFRSIDGEPYLQIAEHVDWVLDIHNSRGESEEQELYEAANQPFKLEDPPLFRAHLWTDTVANHTLLLNFHHSIIDGWSLGIFLSELSYVYTKIAAGEEPYLPPLELDYADYASWQHSSLESNELVKGMDYWKKTLDGAPELLELPTDHKRPTIQSYRGNRIKTDLGLKETEALRSLANREKATLFMVMCAAYAVLLARYSRQKDIVIGIPMANRASKDFENMLGYFVNSMPLRLDLRNDLKLSNLLQKTRKVSLDSYDWQSVPFENLVSELSEHRDPKYAPIFQTMFSMDEFKIQDFHLGDCSLIPKHIYFPVAKYDVSMTVEANEDNIHLELEYNTDLFEQESAQQMLEHYQNILKWMVSSPETGIFDFDLLSETERNKILFDFNATSEDFPHNKCVHKLFEEQVERTPNSPAVIFKDFKLNYSEVNQRANMIAETLQKYMVIPQVPVGLYLERSAELVIAILGILKAGSPYVPIDPIFPEERRNEIIVDSGMQIILTQASLSHTNFPSGLKLITIDQISDSDHPVAGPNPENAVEAQDLAYIIYTSGSTGKPNGVEITHRSLVNSLLSTNQRTDLSSGDMSMLVTTPVFDQSVFDILGPLCCGGSVMVASEEEVSDSNLLAKRITESPLAWMDATPAHWRLLQLGGWMGKSGLKILCGGDAFPQDLAEWLIQNCGYVYNLYGPTEAAIQCTSTKLTPGQPITVGKPIANTRIYILDAKRNPVPIGVIGELYISGEGLARGYHNQPKLTAEKFVHNPFTGISGDRMYASGDLARFHKNGEIEIIGRTDDQVKVRGYRIEPGEIETALKQIHGIDQAIVLVNEGTQGDKRLIAFVCLSRKEDHESVSEKSLDARTLRNSLREKIPAYMLPNAFVFLDAIPLTANGKIDKTALLKHESIPDQVQYEAPENSIEEQLISIWQELLGYERIGVEDDFFESGGHSLLAVRLFSKIEEYFDIKLPLAVLFQNPTIKGLANKIQSGSYKSAWSSLVSIKPEGKKPPFFIVHGVGGGALYYKVLAKYLDKDQPLYGFQSRGFDLESSPLETIEEMASHYLQEMQELYPSGPYLIGGHSFGGMVAYEMAIQLYEQGRKAALVAIFDTYANISKSPDINWITRISLKMKKMAAKIKYHTHEIMKVSTKEKFTYLKSGLLRREERLHLQKLGDRIMKLKSDNQQIPEYIQNVEQANDIAANNYLPVKYPGTITLFRAKEKVMVEEPDEITNGWRYFAKDVQVCEVPGTHTSLMVEPNISALAARLQEILDQKVKDR